MMTTEFFTINMVYTTALPLFEHCGYGSWNH